jgi:hypothetical protein
MTSASSSTSSSDLQTLPDAPPLVGAVPVKPHPLSHDYRHYLHKTPHTHFYSFPDSPGVCTACDSETPMRHKCIRCALLLCVPCRDLITSPLLRGNLHGLISRVARWKMGFSGELLKREAEEARVGGDLSRRRRLERCESDSSCSSSSLRLEVFNWMLWDEEDEDLESDGSEDSVYDSDYDADRSDADVERENVWVQGGGILKVRTVEKVRNVEKGVQTEQVAVVETMGLKQIQNSLVLRKRESKEAEEEKEAGEGVTFDVRYMSL